MMGLREDPRKNGDEDERAKRVQALRFAAVKHVKYLQMAGKGVGIDRVLFGMRMLVGTSEEVPELFNNELFVRSKTWRVSTSHLTHTKFDNWGWGEVVPNGVGIAYSIHAGHCVFNVTAMKSTNYSKQLVHLLGEALSEMKTMLEFKSSKGRIQSKL